MNRRAVVYDISRHPSSRLCAEPFRSIGVWLSLQVCRDVQVPHILPLKVLILPVISTKTEKTSLLKGCYHCTVSSIWTKDNSLYKRTVPVLSCDNIAAGM